MSGLVLLARHASHAEVGALLSGRSEIGLSERGLAEAETLARRLDGVPLSSIHASPRRRTQQTAGVIALRQRLPVTTAPDLDEIDFGEWSGRSFADLEAEPAWRRWNAERATAATAGGETMAEVTTRALRHIARIATSEAPVLCVTHCDVIRGVVAHCMGVGFGRMFDFDVDPASLTTLAFSEGGVRLIALNERPLVAAATAPS